MWDAGQTLRVSTHGGSVSLRTKIREYAEIWTQYANIHFHWVDWLEPAEIRIGFNERATASNSSLGRNSLLQGGESMTFKFTEITDLNRTTIGGDVLHEFGHALGLLHEHQSPAAGIQWNKQKVYDDLAIQGWSRGDVDHNIFDKYSASSTNYTAFDPRSIMAYQVPASWTTDGVGLKGNNELSATDKEFIGNWYSSPPSPRDAAGQLRTGDDCDEIEFVVEYNVVAITDVVFKLEIAPHIWRKAIHVPVGNGWQKCEVVRTTRDPSAYTAGELTIAKAELDSSRPIGFSKAKTFGILTALNYTWDVLTALPGGTRVNLNWKRDRC
jgi:hypothetical protein